MWNGMIFQRGHALDYEKWARRERGSSAYAELRDRIVMLAIAPGTYRRRSSAIGDGEGDRACAIAGEHVATFEGEIRGVL
jgi:hypothetical protein